MRTAIIAFGTLLLIVSGVDAGGAQEEQTAEPKPALQGLTTGQGEIDTAGQTRVVQHDLDTFAENMMSGGPPPDGIPSIDQPEFLSPEEVDLDPGDPVIGLAYEGVVRAYPQRILVYHEIVNHQIGGENLAVTYCPLTATAQGFKSGTTTLGVSGRLVNSNLVMYDRDTGSLWPQIGGTAVAGARKGESLEEVNLYWTTWGNWLEKHPETEVLSTDTGHLRNYDRDPYGSYNPRGGYYSNEGTLFPSIYRGERYPAKQMVIGGRTGDRAAYFVRDSLREQGIQETDHFIAVYDPTLETGYIYRKEADGRFDYDRGRAIDVQSGEGYAPDELPLPRVIPIEGFYFAWIAFYPESEHPE